MTYCTPGVLVTAAICGVLLASTEYSEYKMICGEARSEKRWVLMVDGSIRRRRLNKHTVPVEDTVLATVVTRFSVPHYTTY
jgi:hypothetical protein